MKTGIRVKAGPSVSISWPAMVVAVWLIACLGSTEPLNAQNRPRQPGAAQQTPQPRVGEYRWSADGNSWLRWSGRQWLATGWTRTFPVPTTRGVYDVRFNGSPMMRIDMNSTPGWTHAYDWVGTSTGVWRRWPNNNPRQVFYLARGQWQSPEQYLVYLIQLLNQLVALENQRRAGTRPPQDPCIKPGDRLIAPNVREAIPLPNSAWCRTPEEEAYIVNSNSVQLGIMIGNAQGSACRFAQSATPFNPVTGQLNTDWHPTATGPQRNFCP